MEIGRWLYFVVVNCALVCYIVAKPFSLNKLIESESKQKEVKEVIHTTLLPKIEESEPASERFSLNRGLKPLNRISKKIKEGGTKLDLIPLGKKISPLKYRRTFQIKSPLKPKRVRNSLRTRHKRKNQSIKREIDGDVILNKKYVPLLRSLSMLFDDILGSDSGESLEKAKHRKRVRYYPEGDKDVSCKCARQREPKSGLKSEEETVTFSEAFTSEDAVTTEATTETTDNPSTINLRGFRQHKNVPLLLPRNTSGAWRNNHGLGERGGAAHNGSTERYISGNNGDSEYNSERGQEQSYAESDEEHTDSDSRNDASRVRIRGAGRGREYRNNTEEVIENDAISKDEAENLLESRENTAHHNGAFKLETERDKTKSGKLLSEFVRKQRGFISTDKDTHFAKSLQSEENDKENILSIAHDSAGNQQLADGDGPNSSKNKKVNAGTETVIHKNVEATNWNSTKSAKVTKIKASRFSPFSDFTKSEKYNAKRRNDESYVDTAYDPEIRRVDIEDAKSTKDQETSTKFETVTVTQYKEPVLEQSRDISTTSKNITLAANLTKSTNTEYKEKNGSIEHGKSRDADNSFSKRLVSSKLDTIHTIPEVENSQYWLKPKSSKSRRPVVMIIDGYSVTRHKNGENKLAEKAIHIRP